MGRHSCHTELVDLDLNLLSRAAQTGAFGKGGVKLALIRVSVKIAARTCYEAYFLYFLP